MVALITLLDWVFMTRLKQLVTATTFLMLAASISFPVAAQTRAGAPDGQEEVPEKTAALKLSGPPWLGVRLRDSPKRGVSVDGVARSSPAKKAGIVTGDQLLRVGAEPIKSAEHLQILIRGRRTGDTLPLTLVRSGKTKTVSVTLEEMPSRQDVVARHLLGRAAPDFGFELIAPDGGKTRLSAFAGKPVVLEFWATWCGPCREMSANLSGLKSRYGDRLHVVALSAEDEKVVEKFVRAKGASYVIGQDYADEAHAAYFVGTFPTVMLIDAEGKIAAVALGNGDFPRFAKQVESLMGAP